MTVTISYSTVPTNLAALSSSDITIKDVDKIPVQGVELLCPIMFPDPSGWMDGITVTRETMGVGGAGKYDLSYNLHYIYLHSPAGGNISDLDNYNSMITKLGIISSLIVNNDQLGVDDVTIESISALGYLEGPDGIVFNGCRITLGVLEFLEG